MGLGADGRPLPFQVTASPAASAAGPVRLTPWWFDVLHLDGEDLLDAPLSRRAEVLERLAPAAQRAPRLVTDDLERARAFADRCLADGLEGVVVKRLDAAYDAGRRGGAWLKVKPRHTLDLVVLAVEHGHGRRRGWLSNLHLGARHGDGFVMLGKTFKGLTDDLLRWQTERFRELEVSDDGWVVTVRPEQVVEVAFDGVQTSPRYPGGVALRFARVLRYRDDKPAGAGRHPRGRPAPPPLSTPRHASAAHKPASPAARGRSRPRNGAARGDVRVQVPDDGQVGAAEGAAAEPPPLGWPGPRAPVAQRKEQRVSTPSVGRSSRSGGTGST